VKCILKLKLVTGVQVYLCLRVSGDVKMFCFVFVSEENIDKLTIHQGIEKGPVKSFYRLQDMVLQCKNSRPKNSSVEIKHLFETVNPVTCMIRCGEHVVQGRNKSSSIYMQFYPFFLLL
jgi:hypothetical protein